ncbi:uncharacterized protein LOC118182790, partial [Stegodyphus dumicola]|uniref:uncharacterized protein LOC118182790 n=1 Tax=Stegodyphus dumicola TaxID=202533 RepID=UPI0015AA4252
MKISLRILPFLLFMLFIIHISDSVEEEEDEEDSDELSRTFRLQGSDRPCSYRRRQGFCKKRSDCKRPTRHTCRIGLDPIVCCLDERKVTTTIRTTLPPKTRRPSQPKPKPDNIRGIDLTFRGCGTRSPKDPDADKVANNADTSGRRRGGLFSRRLGKRSIFNPEYIGLSRRRRNVQHVIVGGVAAVENSWPWM